jgi:cell division protease FtsH
MALGFTFTPPERDRIHETRVRLEGQMAMAMGGRAAEILIFKDVTTGASSDIEQVTRIARAMVTSWGMSKLGPVNLNPQMDTSGGARIWMEPTKISEAKQYEVDQEVEILVDLAMKTALSLLKENKVKLDKLAKRLVEVETIDGEEFEEMMKKD